MKMMKMVIIHKLKDENDRPAMERWFRRYHVPDVLAAWAPWVVTYQLYRPVPPPPGAEEFGCYNYRVHENWSLDMEYKRAGKGVLRMTPQPCDSVDAIVVKVPGEPTEDFLGSELTFDDHTILRWVTAFRYPEGVSVEEGEDWYLNVHVPEMMKTPGLNRFFSYKSLVANSDEPVLTGGKFADHDDLFFATWHRLSELWFDNNNGWVKGILENPPQLTPPAWATRAHYPFLVPGKEFISTFLLESPDRVYTREDRALYF